MNFTTTAPDRKTLVKAIAEYFELDPAYNGPPTFSYSVGEITIDRDGTVAIEDEKTAARLRAFLIEKGWMETEPAAPAAEAEPDLEEPVMDIGCPLKEMTVLSLTNLIHMLYSKQYILWDLPPLDTNFDTKLVSSFFISLAKFAPKTPCKPLFLQFGREPHPLLQNATCGLSGPNVAFFLCRVTI